MELKGSAEMVAPRHPRNSTTLSLLLLTDQAIFSSQTGRTTGFEWSTVLASSVRLRAAPPDSAAMAARQCQLRFQILAVSQLIPRAISSSPIQATIASE